MKKLICTVLVLIAPALLFAAPKASVCDVVRINEGPRAPGLINFDEVDAELDHCVGAISGRIKLSGVNSSICLAADNLREFLADARPNEKVRVTYDQFENSSESGGSFGFEVLRAARQSSAHKLEPVTVIEHRRPVKCLTTQVVVLRN